MGKECGTGNRVSLKKGERLSLDFVRSCVRHPNEKLQIFIGLCQGGQNIEPAPVGCAFFGAPQAFNLAEGGLVVGFSLDRTQLQTGLSSDRRITISSARSTE